MNDKKLYALLLWIQGVYTFVTALWAIIDIDSFMIVTGPKTDVWLVKTVAALLLAISVFLLLCNYYRMSVVPVAWLGILTTAGLAFVDFYYTANDTIRWIYALDGIAEVVFLIVWIYLLFRKDRIDQI